MTKTEDQLENEIFTVQDKIINAGKYIPQPVKVFQAKVQLLLTMD